jgi:hypothetical protein
MAFTKSSFGARTYLKYSDCEQDEVLLTGFYVGEEMSKFKNQLYVFRRVENDEVVCLNATGKLTKWIDNSVETGDLVQITYKGKKPISYGPMMGKEAHDFEFAIDFDHRAKFKDNNPQLAPQPAKHTAKMLSDAMDEGTL